MVVLSSAGASAEPEAGRCVPAWAGQHRDKELVGVGVEQRQFGAGRRGGQAGRWTKPGRADQFGLGNLGKILIPDLTSIKQSARICTCKIAGKEPSSPRGMVCTQHRIGGGGNSLIYIVVPQPYIVVYSLI